MRVSGVPWGGEHGHGQKSRTTAGVVHNTYGQWGGDVNVVGQNGSSHFVVGKEDGQWIQLADTDSITYNCGNWTMNNCSVSIEFTGTSDEDLTSWQVKAGAHIIQEVSEYYGIPMTYDDGSDGPNDTPPFSGWYSHRAIQPDSGSQHSDFISWPEWTAMMNNAGIPTVPGGDDEMTQEQMDTLGLWMKQQRELEQQTLGQWLKDVEGRVNAHTDSAIAAAISKIPTVGGLSKDEMTAIIRAEVRSELNKTRLIGG